MAKEGGVTLPQSGSSTEHLDKELAKKLAFVIRTRAEKIRNGVAPRDASSYVQQMDKQWFRSEEEGDVGTALIDFDDPDGMNQTANFFDSSGGVTLSY